MQVLRFLYVSSSMFQRLRNSLVCFVVANDVSRVDTVELDKSSVVTFYDLGGQYASEVRDTIVLGGCSANPILACYWKQENKQESGQGCTGPRLPA